MADKLITVSDELRDFYRWWLKTYDVARRIDDCNFCAILADRLEEVRLSREHQLQIFNEQAILFDKVYGSRNFPFAPERWAGGQVTLSNEWTNHNPARLAHAKRFAA